MKRRLPFVLAWLAGACTLQLASPAQADSPACFPKCRSGYLCSPQGTCVSECNPPCGSGEVCKAGECVAQPQATPAVTRNPELVLAAGLGAQVASETAPVVLTSFSAAFGGDQAFLAGVQGGVAFFKSFIGTSTVGEVGLNLGYRGTFTRSDLGVGFLAVFQPQVWTGTSPLLGLGGAIGPVFTYGHLVVEVPLSVEYVAVLGDVGYFRTGEAAAVFTPSIFAGVSF